MLNQNNNRKYLQNFRQFDSSEVLNVLGPNEKAALSFLPPKGAQKRALKSQSVI